MLNENHKDISDNKKTISEDIDRKVFICENTLA